MITVSSCDVKLQEVHSGVEKENSKTLDIDVHFSGFSQHAFIHLLLYIVLLSTLGGKFSCLSLVLRS